MGWPTKVFGCFVKAGRTLKFNFEFSKSKFYQCINGLFSKVGNKPELVIPLVLIMLGGISGVVLMCCIIVVLLSGTDVGEISQELSNAATTATVVSNTFLSMLTPTSMTTIKADTSIAKRSFLCRLIGCTTSTYDIIAVPYRQTNPASTIFFSFQIRTISD